MKLKMHVIRIAHIYISARNVALQIRPTLPTFEMKLAIDCCITERFFQQEYIFFKFKNMLKKVSTNINDT